MKKYIIGFIAGCIFMVSATSFASSALEKVESYLKYDLKITLDGKEVTLENTPIIYDGSTYLPLRETVGIFEKSVNWNESTQTVEIKSKMINKDELIDSRTEFQGMRAIIKDGQTFFSLYDFSNLYSEKYQGKNVSPWVFSGEEVTFYDADGNVIDKKSRSDSQVIIIVAGDSYINSKYFPSIFPK